MTEARCESIAQDLGFTNQDEEFWWRATAPSLGELLASCEYSAEEQLGHLRWYHRFIIAALGPRPIAGKKPLFQPCPVFDGSACELSINFKERSQSRTIRFTIEATGYEAGTPTDPFNQEASKLLLRDMASQVANLDLHHFDIFVNDFFLPAGTAESVVKRLPPDTPLSQVWLAFDLFRGGKIMAKVYFMPILQWVHSGAPTTKYLVFATARKCNGEYGTYDAAIDLLDDYLESFPAGQGPTVEMVAIDCLDSPDSRIKMYLRTGANTLARAKDLMTLGGRLSGKEYVQAGLAALAELWPLLFRLGPDDDIENFEVFPPGSYCGCAVETKPGHALPETKLHIPVRKIQGTDAQICDSLAVWFKRRGHAEFAAAYQADLETAFPRHNLHAESGTHTFISFSYTQRTGVYMTMYYSTKIFGAHVKEDIWEGYDNMWKAKRQTLSG
ncbi:aromatic prenyltransferase [Parathielavia hyrcaniae]|uniref:Aromatic prenyltransferase n=1 Tax=Parathielavia hyrcaniae TaxID=113614 RepID=A0AAN6PVL8_9PEZI|nr:aromatic prenyltransferase [Parathielavia hyrcaniae]